MSCVAPMNNGHGYIELAQIKLNQHDDLIDLIRTRMFVFVRHVGTSSCRLYFTHSLDVPYSISTVYNKLHYTSGALTMLISFFSRMVMDGIINFSFHLNVFTVVVEERKVKCLHVLLRYILIKWVLPKIL